MGLVGYESTGWFSRKLVMRVSTVERVEDGTVYAQMPVMELPVCKKLSRSSPLRFPKHENRRQVVLRKPPSG